MCLFHRFRAYRFQGLDVLFSRELTGQGNFNVSLDHRFSLKLLVVLLTGSRSIIVFILCYPHGWLHRADKGATYITVYRYDRSFVNDRGTISDQIAID